MRRCRRRFRARDPTAPPSNRKLIIGLGVGSLVMATLAVAMGIVAWKSKGPVTEIHYLSDPKSKGATRRRKIEAEER